MFGADPKTVARWAKAGKIEDSRRRAAIRRYLPSEVSSGC